MMLQRMTPILMVKNVRKSVEFYCDALGFQMESTHDKLDQWNWAYLTNGNIHLMLAGTLIPPNPLLEVEETAEDSTNYYFYLDDLTVLHQALKTKGYEVSDLYVTFYGMREFWLTDPDGHLLTFGQTTADSLVRCD